MTSRLKLLHSLWGKLNNPTTGGKYSLEECFQRIRSANFNGFECPIANAMEYGPKDKFTALRGDLDFLAMVFTDGPNTPYNRGFTNYTNSQPDYYLPVDKQVKIFQEQVELCLEWGAFKMNCHGGNDYWTQKDADQFFNKVLPWLDQFDTTLTFETHRGRWLYSPWVARDYVPQFDGKLKLCADYSHFINVAEVHPSNKVLQDTFDLLNPYVHHIHARVGFEEGPQVNDPRAPEWEGYVQSHLDTWRNIWNEMDKRGDEEFTVTAEFGPQLYQHCLPYTRTDLADNWEVNNYIGERVKTMYLNGDWQTRAKAKENVYEMETGERGRRDSSTRSAFPVFTDAEKAEYDENGFIFRRGFLSTEEAAKIKETMKNDDY